MSDLPALLDELVAFSRHLRAHQYPTRSELARLEYFHQMLTYHVIYGDRRPTDVGSGVLSGANPEASEARGEDTSSVTLSARRCSIEGCHGGPTLWNISAGRAGYAPVWRCLAHIPPDLNYPVALHGNEWKATGRK